MGDVIRRYMSEKNISTCELAEKMHITTWALYRILQGKRELRIGEYFEICGILGTEPSEMAREAGLYD
jgi:plasmid maintenance system antidote protein VapI